MTRRDLPPGLQLAQSCHALRLFAAEHPKVDEEWYRNSRYLACLSAADEDELIDLAHRCVDHGLRFSAYREPDNGNQITAIAVEPGPRGRRVTSSFPLALRDV